MKRLAVVLVVVAACAKKGGDCAASRLAAQHAIAIAKREAVHAHERITAAASGSNDAALAAIVAREQLLDAWAIAVVQPHPDPIAADAGGSDAPASVVTARVTTMDYVTCAAN